MELAKFRARDEAEAEASITLEAEIEADLKKLLLRPLRSIHLPSSFWTP